MSLGGGDSSGSSKTSQSDARRSEEERRLEQLRQLQQNYDVLAIDDAVLRKQKELEIQRDGELAKATALGASEELLQSIRDHYANESVRVETEAAEAARKIRLLALDVDGILTDGRLYYSNNGEEMNVNIAY